MRKTPEGEERFAKIYAVIDTVGIAAIGTVGILDDEDREFGIRLRKNRINSQSIGMLEELLYSDQSKLDDARQQLEPVLLRLKKNPDNR